MRDTLQVECLAQALSNYAEAASDEANARANYEGYSWGYHGEYYIKRRTEAATALEDALSKLIDERAAAIFSRMMGPL